MFKDAEKEIDVITSKDELLQFLPASFTEQGLEALGMKRVKIRMILEVPQHETSLPKSTENYLSSKVTCDIKYFTEAIESLYYRRLRESVDCNFT